MCSAVGFKLVFDVTRASMHNPMLCLQQMFHNKMKNVREFRAGSRCGLKVVSARFADLICWRLILQTFVSF